MSQFQICIDKLKLEAWVGIHLHEQSYQTIILDIIIEINGKLGRNFDHIEYALNYEEIVTKISDLCKKNKYQLLETLADEVCEIILAFPGVLQVWLKVGKPNILFSELVSVKLHRQTIQTTN